MNALLHWLTAPEWSQVVKTLLHSLWQGALIAAALVLTMRRLANPYARYCCSLVALAAIPVAGIVTWAILSSFNHQPPLPIAAEAASPPNLIPLNQGPVTKLIVFADHTAAPPQSRWTAWLALAWLIGAITMLGRVGAKVAGAERLRRACRPLAHPQIAQLVTEARRAVGLVQQIRVAVTDKLTSPAVVGVLVPTLILPLTLVTTLTPEQIRFILLHELAHIRRGDYFANLFQLFAEALLFFNPAVWWVSHQVRREREACCDALAIELSGAPADYARTLVHVAENVLSSTPAGVTAFGGDREPSSLADRIQRLLVPGYRPSLRLTWRAMIGAFVLGAALLVLSAEGTRVAVAQIAKSTGEAKQSTAPPQSKETLPFENTTELSNHFTNEFIAPGYVGPRIPAKMLMTNSSELGRAQRNLKDLRFKLVSCSNKPLEDLFRELAEESKILDPAGNGFSFLVVPFQLNSSAVTINPPLTNANLLEILAAIQGIPQLQITRVDGKGWMTLKPDAPPITLNHGVSPSELEAEQQKPHGSDNRSVQTNPLVVQVGLENLGGVTDWDVNVANTLLLPGLQLSRVTNVAAGDKIPFLGDLPWVRKLFASSQMKSAATDFVQLSQLSTLNKEIRSEHNITDSLSVRFQDTAAGNDLVSAQLDRQNDRLAVNDNVGSEKPSRIDESTTANRIFYSNAPLSAVPGKLIYTSESRRALLNKLNQIQLDRVYFNATPLSSVIGHLQQESWRRDPDGLGITFVFNHDLKSKVFKSTDDPFDLLNTGVTINPPLRNVSVLDTLRAIVKGASKPIRFGIEENAVVISAGKGVTPLFMREFKVKPTLFENWLAENGFPITEPSGTTNSSHIAESIRGVLAKAGIALESTKAKSIYYGDKKGNLLVRATKEELDQVENLLQPILSQSQASHSASITTNASGLYTRTFRVDPNTFGKALESITATPVTGANITGAVRSFFATLGVELTPPKGVYYNDRAGELLVRSTTEDLDVIEATLMVADKPTPQVSIKVRFVEVERGETGSDWFLGTISNHSISHSSAANPATGTASNAASQSFTGILTDPQFRVVLRALEQRNSSSLFSESEVTTLSGRQAQVQAGEMKTAINGIGQPTIVPGQSPSNDPTNLLYRTRVQPFGPVLAVIPTVSEDGYTIQLTVIPTVTEFLGYDDPGKALPKLKAGSNDVSVSPLPRMRLRQMITNAVVTDGQTLVLGVANDQIITKQADGGILKEPNPDAEKKQLLIFITATIVDPAGNRSNVNSLSRPQRW